MALCYYSALFDNSYEAIYEIEKIFAVLTDLLHSECHEILIYWPLHYQSKTEIPLPELIWEYTSGIQMKFHKETIEIHHPHYILLASAYPNFSHWKEDLHVFVSISTQWKIFYAVLWRWDRIHRWSLSWAVFMAWGDWKTRLPEFIQDFSLGPSTRHWAFP